MDSTPNLALPLLQPSQAQKHVTVNEALLSLDATAQLALEAIDQSTPPSSPVEGASYAVPAGASGEWVGQEGKVAVWSNGGWVFMAPKTGWRGWDRLYSRAVLYDGDAWRVEGLSRGASGSGVQFVTVEAEHLVTPGAQNTLATSIPAKATLFAASARVIDEITGTVSAWRLGHAGASDRFGSGIGLAPTSYSDGILGQPQTYYASEPLVIEGEGGDFSAGRIRVALHFLRYDLPGV